MKSLDGKKIMFVGNSFIYYGGCVEPVNQREPNFGQFKKLCDSQGMNVTVYNCTYGGHRLRDFTEEGCKFAKKCKDTPCFGSDLLRDIDLDDIDVVFFSEAGENNPNFIYDSMRIMARFKNPKTEFVYLAHTYFHYKNHTNVLGGLETLRRRGVTIADWGLVCYRLSEDIHFLTEGGPEYKITSFIKNKGDCFHENPLGGYITALTCYAAYTGNSAVGLPVDFIKDVHFSSSNTLEEFRDVHYENPTDTNFIEILNNPTEILKIQQLVDKVVAETK